MIFNEGRMQGIGNTSISQSSVSVPNSLSVTGISTIQAEPKQDSVEYVIERRDIILENDINSQRYCMPSIEVKFKHDPEPCLFFSDLIENLKKQNFPLSNCMLFCLDQKREMFVFIANDPMVQPYFLPPHICGIQGNIYIKFRSFQNPQLSQSLISQQSQNSEQLESTSQIKKKIVPSRVLEGHPKQDCQNQISQNIKEEDPAMVSDENTTFSQQQGNNLGCDGNVSQMEDGSKVGKRKKKMMSGNQSTMNSGKGSSSAIDKRVKERYIERVREKVTEWRAMHEIGLRDKDGNLQKLNLDHAANSIGISRKTLDDYYLQLRRAEQLGFDFEKNKSEKMGTLRKFVKDESKKQSKRQSTAGQIPFNNHSLLNDESDEGNENSSIEQNVVHSNGSSQNLNLNAYNILSNNGRGSSNNLSASTKITMPSLANAAFGLNNQGQQARTSGTSQSGSIFSTTSTQGNQLQALVGTSLGLNSQIVQQQSMITPYNYNGSQTFGYNSGGFNHPQSSYRQSPNQQSALASQFLQPSLTQYFPQNGRNSYMNQEPFLESFQRSSNNMGLNSQIGSQIFNPGSQFLNGQQSSGNFNNPSLLSGADFSLSNIMGNENLNLGNNTLNQQDNNRFNHFSLISFGNNSQIIDERGSINFMTPNQSSLAHNSINQAAMDGRQSNGSIYQMAEENYITTQVYPTPSSNNNSTILNH